MSSNSCHGVRIFPVCKNLQCVPWTAGSFRVIPDYPSMFGMSNFKNSSKSKSRSSGPFSVLTLDGAVGLGTSPSW